MPARKRDPEVVIALRQQTQILSLLNEQIQRLDKSHKAFVDSMSILVRGMERRWDTAIEAVQSRDVALAQFELEVLKRLDVLLSRQQELDTCRSDLDKLMQTVELERRRHLAALNSQREAQGKLRASMVLYDRAA